MKGFFAKIVCCVELIVLVRHTVLDVVQPLKVPDPESGGEGSVFIYCVGGCIHIFFMEVWVGDLWVALMMIFA